MLFECQECDFFLTKNETFCPNCGFPASGYEAEKLSDESASNFNITFSGIVAIVAIGISLYKIAPDYNDFSNVFFYGITGFLVGSMITKTYTMLLSRHLEKKDRQKRLSFSENPHTLLSREETIFHRAEILNKELREIELLQAENKILPNAQTDWQLREARQSVLTQIALCELQKERIAIIRAQNSLLPLLYAPDYYDDKEGLYKIKQALHQLKTIRLSLTNDYAIEFPGESLKERELFLEQMEKTAESLFKLREDIIKNQAVASLEKAQFPNAEPVSDDLTHRIESFNIQTLLTEFDDSYKRLEDVYSRNKLNRIRRK